jgi:hypothetical protein
MAEERTQRRLAAIMAADVVGYMAIEDWPNSGSRAAKESASTVSGLSAKRCSLPDQ